MLFLVLGGAWMATCAERSSEDPVRAAAMVVLAALPVDSLCQSARSDCEPVRISPTIRATRFLWPATDSSAPALSRLTGRDIEGLRRSGWTVAPHDIQPGDLAGVQILLGVITDSLESHDHLRFAVAISLPGSGFPFVGVVDLDRRGVAWRVVGMSLRET